MSARCLWEMVWSQPPTPRDVPLRAGQGPSLAYLLVRSGQLNASRVGFCTWDSWDHIKGKESTTRLMTCRAGKGPQGGLATHGIYLDSELGG